MFRWDVSLPLLLALTATAATGQTPDAPSRTSLLKTGLLGHGAEFGLATKGLLLDRPAVQEELKLTPDQKARLKKGDAEVGEILKRQAADRRRQIELVRAQNDPQAYEAAVQELFQTDLKEMQSLKPLREQPLLKILDARQRTRLEQIQLQSEGPMAFTRPEVQERLNLNPDQVESIGAVIEEGRAAVARAAEIPAGILPADGGRLTPEQRRERLRAVLASPSAKAAIETGRESVRKAQRSTMQAIGKTLTKKQRARFDAMLGEPFEFAKLRADAPRTGGASTQEMKDQ